MGSRERWRRLLAEAAGRSADTVGVGAACVIETMGRAVHLRLDERRDEVTLSTPVYFTDVFVDRLHPDLVAEFNAFHVARSGYRLSHDAESRCLLVGVTRSLEALTRSGLKPFLAELLDRCVSCTRWYADQCEGRETRMMEDLLAHGRSAG
jgi:hypothetical protein